MMRELASYVHKIFIPFLLTSVINMMLIVVKIIAPAPIRVPVVITIIFFVFSFTDKNLILIISSHNILSIM